MTDDLKMMEQESADILALLRETRDEENFSVQAPPCRPYNVGKSVFAAPYWLVAASVMGFALGLAIPRGNVMTHTTLCSIADSCSSTGRSLALGDVNFDLMVIK